MAFGTSLTSNYLWQDRLRRRLAYCLRRPVEAVSIATVAKSAMASSWGLQNVPRVVAAQPDVVLIEFAINDAYAPYKMSVAQSRENTAAIIKRLKNAMPSARLMLMTTNPTVSDNKRPKLARYYAQYAGVGARYGADIIDLFPIWSKAVTQPGGRKLLSDGVHPTRRAYDVVLPTITRALCKSADERMHGGGVTTAQRYEAGRR